MLDTIASMEQIVVMKARPPLKVRLLDLLLYQGGWLLAVLGARVGQAGWGVVALVLYAAAHASCAPRRRRARDLVWIATALGVVVDGGLVFTHVIAFPPAASLGPLPIPLWMVALWTAFGAAFSLHVAPLVQRRWAAWLLGALGGPAVYATLGTLGVLGFPRGAAVSLLAVGAAWAPTMAALRWAHGASRPRYRSTQTLATPDEAPPLPRPLALADDYFAWLDDNAPLVTTRRQGAVVVLRLFGLPAIRLLRVDEAGDPAPAPDRGAAAFRVVGGLFARPHGRMTFTRSPAGVTVDLVGFQPRYSPALYALTHARVHAWVMNAWLASLRRR